MARLGDLGQIITGNTPKTADVENYASKDIAFIKPSDIQEDKLTMLSGAEFYISEYAREKARILSPGCILVTCIGIVGKVAINNIECAFNQQINAIVPDTKRCDTKYIAYAIQSQQHRLQDIANAAVVPILNKTQFSDIEISLPRLEEQRRIAVLLDKVSDLITKRRAQLDKLDLLVKSRFVEMFGKTQYPYTALIKLIVEGAGLSYGIVVPGDNVKDGVPMIRPSDFKNDNLYLEDVYRVAPEIEAKYARTRLIGDEILVQVIGQPGQVMLADIRCKGMNVTRNLAVIRPNCNRINRIYLKIYMQTQEAQAFMLGETKQSTLKQLPLSRLKELEIPVPSMALQEQFAAFVEQTEKSKLTIQQSLDKLETLKKALMQQYFG